MDDKRQSSTALNPRALLRQFGVRPDRRLGQNFLVDYAARERILKAADLGGSETVLEIGAGLGALTWRLAQECVLVIAVEFDHRLIPILDYVLHTLVNVKSFRVIFLNLNSRITLGVTLTM